VTKDTFLRKVAVLNRDQTKKGVAMQSTTISRTLALPSLPFLFSPTSLYAHLLTLTDHRVPRGVRYPLPVLLTIATLAKLAEQNAPRAIADWARLRAPALADLFGLDRPTMPHATTWNRAFGGAIDPQQSSRPVADFLLAATTPPPRGTRKRRCGMIAVCLDGKTVRGTIPAGMTRGVHLLAAYLPQQGIVLVEVAVEGKENEIVTAREVRSLIDVQGCVVTGDALFAQRALSRRIRRQGGDYLWCVEGNQETLYGDIATLFTTAPLPALLDDFLTATSLDTAHGRYEERRRTASSLLVGYTTWPAARRVFRLERRALMEDGSWRASVAYGITSLPRSVADAARLLALARGYWGIENGLLYRRDATLGEDRSQLRRGNGPQVLATLNDLAVGRLLREGRTNAAAGRRIYAAFPQHAFNVLTAA
jgi:predicted transposase YbfD/YdcC